MRISTVSAAVRAAVLLWGSIMISGAQPVTEPAGFYRLTLLGSSDSYVSLPFTRPEAAAALVYGTNATQIQVQGSPGWTVNQWAYQGVAQSNTYYLFIRSGLKSGNYYTITSNSADRVTLDLAGDNLGGLMAGDRVTIIPYWTLNTLFPGGKGIHPAPVTSVRPTEILIPNYAGSGIDLSPSAGYFFLNSTKQWRLIGNTNFAQLDRGNDVILPDHYIIVRHKVATNTTLTSLGAVVMTNLVLPVMSRATNKQDNALALTRPIPMTLNSLGLIESGAFTPSRNLSVRNDELHVFSNEVAQLDRSPSAVYIYVTNTINPSLAGWRRLGVAGTNDYGSSNVFGVGAGIRIRRISNGSGTRTVDWINWPNY